MSKIKMYSAYRNQLTSAKDIRSYILGGRGIVTLLSPTEKHHTYMFKRPVDSTFPEDVLFVYAVHNAEQLFYIGMIEQGKFRLTMNSRFLPDTEIVRGARYIMRMSEDDDLVQRTKMQLFHEGLCAICGRSLISPESLKTGIGPKCMRRIKY